MRKKKKKKNRKTPRTGQPEGKFRKKGTSVFFDKIDPILDIENTINKEKKYIKWENNI